MTALVDVAPIVKFAERLLPHFATAPLDRDNPIVLILLNRWRRISGLPPGPVPNDGAAWRAVTFDDKIVLVYGEQWTGKQVLVTNICPAANRYGALAVYALLAFYRQAYAANLITGFVAPVLARNKQMIRALTRVFGDLLPVGADGYLVPHAHIYTLGEV